jgi:hypothetical protein
MVPTGTGNVEKTPGNTTNSTYLKLSVLSLGTLRATTPAGTISLDNSQTYNDFFNYESIIQQWDWLDVCIGRYFNIGSYFIKEYDSCELVLYL